MTNATTTPSPLLQLYVPSRSAQPCIRLVAHLPASYPQESCPIAELHAPHLPDSLTAWAIEQMEQLFVPGGRRGLISEPMPPTSPAADRPSPAAAPGWFGQAGRAQRTLRRRWCQQLASPAAACVSRSGSPAALGRCPC